MSKANLKITVNPVTGFVGYPLAYAVSAPREFGLLHEGSICIGDSVTLPVDEATEYRVELHLPTQQVVSQTLLSTSPDPVPSVIFEVSDCLKAMQPSPQAGLTPFVLISSGGPGLLPPPVAPEELFPLPRSSSSPGTTSWDDLVFPASAAALELHRRSLVNRLTAEQALASSLPKTRFVLRPFVRLWKWSPGESFWRLDPALTPRMQDKSDGRRLVTLGEGLEGYCLEVGTPSGPNHLVYLPPGPVAVEIRLQGDFPQAGRLELTLRTQPFADLLLSYVRMGAITEARAVAAILLEKPDQGGERIPS
jgi:hypothetical protein